MTFNKGLNNVGLSYEISASYSRILSKTMTFVRLICDQIVIFIENLNFDLR